MTVKRDIAAEWSSRVRQCQRNFAERKAAADRAIAGRSGANDRGVMEELAHAGCKRPRPEMEFQAGAPPPSVRNQAWIEQNTRPQDKKLQPASTLR